MRNDFAEKLESCADFADIFELVKTGVEKTLEKSRAGLMLGLANLGGSRSFFLGAYYTLDSNMIVMNSFPLKRIRETNLQLFKPYVFHVLLHEYIHSLGWHNEETTRKLTRNLCEKLLGKDHLATQLASDINKFLPNFSYADIGWFPREEPEIFIVSGFDKGHLTYVS